MDRMEMVLIVLATILLALVIFIKGGIYAMNHPEKYTESKIDCIKQENLNKNEI